MKSDTERGRDQNRKNKYDRGKSRSKSRTPKDIECHYCHKKGHIRRYCRNLKKDLED